MLRAMSIASSSPFSFFVMIMYTVMALVDLRNLENKIEKYRFKILEKLQVLAIKIVSYRSVLLDPV
jgi:cell division protein ZapA (FtsZ GTPase activity inhibitor)